MKDHVDLRIFSVTDIEFTIRHLDPIDPAKVNFKVNGKLLKPMPTAKVLGLETEILCAYIDENIEQILMRYVNRMTFYVDNFDEIIVNDSNENLVVDNGVVRLLLDIAIPTIRGILIEKTARTSLAGSFLPLIPASLLLP